MGLLSSIPLYADAAQNKLLQGELGSDAAAAVDHPDAEAEAVAGEPFSFLWRYIGAWSGNVIWADYAPVSNYLRGQAPSLVGLPLKTQVHHVATDKMRLFPSEDAAFIPDEPLMWVSLGFVTGLEDHIQLLEGGFPVVTGAGEAVEILVSRTTADTLGLQVGEHAGTRVEQQCVVHPPIMPPAQGARLRRTEPSAS